MPRAKPRGEIVNLRREKLLRLARRHDLNLMFRNGCSAIVGVMLAAGMLAAGHASDAVAQMAAVNITVDGAGAGTPLERVWAFHGYDEVNYTTTPPGQELLRVLGAIDRGPSHIRSHFLLNSGDGTPAFKWGSTNVYTEDASGQPAYSWALMDGIMDAITRAGTFPLVEIAFTPQALTSAPANVPYQNTSTYTLDGSCFYPPKDHSKWAALIGQWASHAKDRYPDVENSWQWELWNEPDIGYWNGTAAEYFKLYDYTEAALHQVLPGASLGGPAVAGAGSAFFKQFLQHCATGTNAVTGTTGTRLDMISFHAKGGTAIVDGHVEMNLGSQLRLHRIGFTTVAAMPTFKQTPIVISEADPDGCAACPVSTTPADAYRNSPAYGAYVVSMMKRTLDLEASMGVNVRGLLTWAFLFNDAPYFAGYRTLATNGIHLPVLNAFKLLGSLDGDRLTVTSTGALTLDDLLTNSVRQQPDVDAIATRHGQTVQVLVWNYHDDLVTAPAALVQVTAQLPAGFGSSVQVTHMRVDETHGDAYTAWVAQGKPPTPTAAQISALQQAMQPAPLEPARQVAVTAGSVSLDFMLPRFGISLLTLSPTSPGDAATSDADASAMPSDGGVGAAMGGGGCSCRVLGQNARAPTAAEWIVPAGIALTLLAYLRRRRVATNFRRPSR
jgi:xylan 1,4-beta-xylosidase